VINGLGKKLTSQPIDSTGAVLCGVPNISSYKVLLLYAVDTCKFSLQREQNLKIYISNFISTEIFTD
jgi:hypothetical protein